jgi:hypothetical protein
MAAESSTTPTPIGTTNAVIYPDNIDDIDDPDAPSHVPSSTTTTTTTDEIKHDDEKHPEATPILSSTSTPTATTTTPTDAKDGDNIAITLFEPPLAQQLSVADMEWYTKFLAAPCESMSVATATRSRSTAAAEWIGLKKPSPVTRQTMARYGVPPSLRSRVWPILIMDMVTRADDDGLLYVPPGHIQLWNDIHVKDNHIRADEPVVAKKDLRPPQPNGGPFSILDTPPLPLPIVRSMAQVFAVKPLTDSSFSSSSTSSSSSSLPTTTTTAAARVVGLGDSSLRGVALETCACREWNPLPTINYRDLCQPSRWQDGLWRDGIRVDIPRTRPLYYADGMTEVEDPKQLAELRAALTRVLNAWLTVLPKPGYTAGLAMVASRLITVLGEERAFQTMVILATPSIRSSNRHDCDMILHRWSMGVHQQSNSLRTYQFEQSLIKVLPTLAARLTEQTLDSRIYMTGMFITFGAYRLPIPLQARLVSHLFLFPSLIPFFLSSVTDWLAYVFNSAWEYFLTDGFRGLTMFQLSIMEHLSPQLMKAEFPDMIAQLNDIGETPPIVVDHLLARTAAHLLQPNGTKNSITPLYWHQLETQWLEKETKDHRDQWQQRLKVTRERLAVRVAIAIGLWHPKKQKTASCIAQFAASPLFERQLIPIIFEMAQL